MRPGCPYIIAGILAFTKAKQRAPHDPVTVKEQVDMTDAAGRLSERIKRWLDVIFCPVAAGKDKMERQEQLFIFCRRLGQNGIRLCIAGFAEQYVKRDGFWFGLWQNIQHIGMPSAR